jgi:hypothetical protein
VAAASPLWVHRNNGYAVQMFLRRSHNVGLYVNLAAQQRQEIMFLPSVSLRGDSASKR